MNLTISLKSTLIKEGHTYTFTIEEYKRLRTDFEAFLRESKPKGGTYNCQLQNGGDPSEIIKELLVDFDLVALINVQIQFDRLNELKVQIEEAKLINEQSQTQNEAS